MLPIKYAFLFGDAILLVMWLAVFLWRRDTRKKILVMSAFIGALSVATNYYWWTVDWWRPQTITGARIGIEYFLIGFAGGGMMAAAYETVFRKRKEKFRGPHSYPSALIPLLLLAFTTALLFWGAGLTSFAANAIAMIFTAFFMFYYRRDLLPAGLASGILMAILSLVFYLPILWIWPRWTQETYLFDTLSGILALGIPIEEFVFWFLAGLIFGPFYEYWRRERFH